MKTLLLALLVVSLSNGQTLQQTLGLSIAQAQQIQKDCSALRPGYSGPRLGQSAVLMCAAHSLDRSQQNKLLAIADALKQDSVAYEAQALRLTPLKYWPGEVNCPSPIRSATSKLGPSFEQIYELQTGYRAGPVVAPKPGELPGRHENLPGRPWSQILSDDQKAKVAEAARQLQLAVEALNMGVIVRLGSGEGLCQ